MKKIIFVLISIILLSSFNISAEENLIEGLKESWDTLWLKNYFTQEQMDDMIQQQQEDFTEYFYSFPWNLAQTIWGKGLNQEETLKYELEMQRVNPEEGLRVYLTTTDFKYAKQYNQMNDIEYMIDNSYYWIAPQKRENFYEAFTCEGKYGANLNTISVLPIESIEFIRDLNSITKQLKDKSVGKVFEMKIISPESRLVFLYIDTDNEEYMIKLYGFRGSTMVMPETELYKIYTVTEIIDAIENIPAEGWHELRRLRNNTFAEKPTYQTEAEQLQNRGLLKGNDNGLDLLKPLTRAEAATMLMRAMGVSESAENISLQTFSDVSSSHWAYGAVENASNMGLVNGMGDGTFAPDSLVTSVQFATMVLRAADEPEFDWQTAVDILIEKEILTEEETQTMDFFTRGDMAKIIYEAMENGLF